VRTYLGRTKGTERNREREREREREIKRDEQRERERGGKAGCERLKKTQSRMTTISANQFDGQVGR